MTFGHVTLTQCWGCRFGEHPNTPHTWMDVDDIDHAQATGQELPADLAKDRPCACKCGGGSGVHVPLTAAQAEATRPSPRRPPMPRPDETGRMGHVRMLEVREEAERGSVNLDADELLWLLDSNPDHCDICWDAYIDARDAKGAE